MATFHPATYAYVHAAQEAGVTGLSVNPPGAETTPFDRLIDDRAAPSFSMAITANTHGLVIDLDPQATGNPRTGLTHLWLPAGNVLGATVNLVEDDNIGFSSSTGLIAQAPVVSGEAQYIEFSQPSVERFMRFRPCGPTQQGTFSWGEFVLTQEFVPVRGASLVRAPDERVYNDVRFPQTGGQSPTLVLGPSQRVVTYPYFSVKQPDIDGVDAMVDYVGMDKPFLVRPSGFYETLLDEIPVLWMKNATRPRRTWAVGAPMNGVASYDYTLDLIESLD